MKLAQYSILCTLLLPFHLFSQSTFEVSFGTDLDEFAEDWVLDQNKNFTIVGYSLPSNSNPLIIRTDMSGNIIWQKSIMTSGNDRLLHVIQIDDENFVSIGTSSSFTNGQDDLLIIKFNKDGEVLQSIHWGSYAVEIIRDLKLYGNSFLVAGSTFGDISGLSGAMLLSFDFDLNVNWIKRFDSSHTDWANGIDVMTDGSLRLSGFTNSHKAGGLHDPMIIKLDSNGNYISSILLLNPRDSGLKQIVEHEGFVYFLGHTWSYGPGDLNFHFNKSLGDGSIQIEKGIGKSGGGRINSLSGAFLSDAGDAFYLPIAEANQNSITNDAALIKIDLDGNIIWEKTFGGEDEDGLFKLFETDSSLFLLGNTRSFGSNGNSDIYFIRADLDGHTQCNAEYTNHYSTSNGFSTKSSGAFNQASPAYQDQSIDPTIADLSFQVNKIYKPEKIYLFDSTICEGQEIEFNLSGFDIEVTWEDGSNSIVRKVNEEGIYFFSTTGCFIPDTSQINVQENVSVDLGSDIVLCDGSTKLLNAFHPAANNYSWNNGSTQSNITASKSGDYYVSVSNECSTQADTLNLTFLDLSKNYFSNDSTLCYGESILINLPFPRDLIQWEDGSNDSIRVLNDPGTYSAYYGVEGCYKEESIDIYYESCPGSIPNAFSPNNDGYNETFAIENIFTRDWELRIFDRNGREIFYSPKYDNSWKGENYSEGLFYYHLSNDNLGDYRGWIRLIR